MSAYLFVNPTLQAPSFPDSLFELEMIHITRFRSGSHNLCIESGRYTVPKTPREMRMCLCGNDTQTPRHVLMDCHIVEENHGILEHNFTSVSEFFNWDKLHDYLIIISKVVKVEMYVLHFCDIKLIMGIVVGGGGGGGAGCHCCQKNLSPFLI